ncbi:MAG: 4-(cytidine 5'-diphospho)-2-C-methyl-D-erythritol kinase [Dehalococcoidia bacterium]|nr:4-(cytidine 5'-diphospho)-2-C-methyl-D-erythritol kinase [Dehalococcoidia bacterium]
MKLRLVAPAKVNWTLEVLGRRDDGYHEVRSVLQTLALHDAIALSPADYLEVRYVGATAGPLAAMEEDLAHRAAEALRQEAGKPELAALIELEKAVPAAAGLGGGSSDAAAVLRGLNRLWGLDFDAERLRRIGGKLGSDVSFFLTGGTAEAGGRGDEVAPLADVPPLAITVAVPHDRLQQKTAQMYRRLRPEHFTSGEHTRRLVEKLAAGGAISDDDVFNTFEAVLFEAMPLAAVLRDECRNDGACPHLAGSGPAFFFLSPLEAKTERRLRRAGVTLIETTTAGAQESTAWEEQ